VRSHVTTIPKPCADTCLASKVLKGS
jgi:hypothetical protein